jgi:hypothetical protein
MLVFYRLLFSGKVLTSVEMNQGQTRRNEEIRNFSDGKAASYFLQARLTTSKSINQITDANTKSFGYPQKRVQANPLLATFNFAYIHWMQVGFFCQFFLTHAKLLSVVPNGVTQDFQLSRTRHTVSAKHESAKTRTPNMGLFYSCTTLVKDIQMDNNSENSFRFNGFCGEQSVYE